MSVTASDLRSYLGVPPNVTDNILNISLNAAVSEAKTAGIPAFANNAQYDMFILSLAAWYYDNRGLQVSGTYQATALATKKGLMDAFVLELRYAKDGEPPVPDDPEDPEDPEEPADAEEATET